MAYSHSITEKEILASARIVDLATGEVLQEASDPAGFINGAITAWKLIEQGKRTAEVEVMEGGFRLVKAFEAKKKNQSGGSVRGKIKGFSKKSRNRMLRRLMKLKWDEIKSGKHSEMVNGVFVTLTYPSDYSQNWEVWKAHLRALRERIRREFGDLPGLWKLEFQERGAPHFHVLLYFPEGISISWIRPWFSRNWFEVVGSGDPKHLKAGTNVGRVHGKAGKLMRYLSKYLAKAQAVERPTGRIWGVWGDLPAGAVYTLRIDYVEFLRRVRKWGKNSPYLKNISQPYGVLIFGDKNRLLKLLSGLTV